MGDASPIDPAAEIIAPEEQHHVPLWRTLLYSLGNAANLLTYTTFNTFIQYFYTTVVGLPPDWVGRGWFAFGFWNAFNDPLAGWLSDRTSTRWGRRRFYIGLLAIPMAIAFALVWLPPFDKSNPTALMVYFLIVISVYDMLQTVITLNQDALFPEMYQETSDRASTAGIRQFIGFVVGNGLAVALTPTIYENFGWTALAVLWGSIAAALYFLSLIGIEEHPELSTPATASLREQLKIVLRNRTFIIVLCINFTTRFILAVLVAVMPFYADYVLKVSGGQLTQLLMVLFAATGLSLFVWQHIISRRGSRTAMLISMSLAAVFAIPLLFVKDMFSMSVVLAFLGFSIGGTALGPDMLFAEVVDEDYVKTGARREGMYRGILGFIFRFPPAVSGLILGEGLAAAGFNADLAVEAQPEAVGTLIRTFSAVLPLISIVVGIGLLLLYPLYGNHLREIQTRVSIMRKQHASQRSHQEKVKSNTRERVGGK